MQWFLMALEKYVVFEGRSRRKEFWMFVLMFVLLGIAINVIVAIASSIFHLDDSADRFIRGVYNLALFCPGIAVGIRRMHDTGRSGWWILLPIVDVVFWCLPSQQGENRYGAAPSLED